MGGFCTLHLGLRPPDRALSLVVAGCGYGSQPERQESFRAESEVIAESFREQGAEEVAKNYALGSARVQLQNKDPRGWQEFARILGEDDSIGAALTMRGVQSRRTRAASSPTSCSSARFPSSALLMLPRTGHTANQEDPEAFTRAVTDFIATVDAGRWSLRDPGRCPRARPSWTSRRRFAEVA